MPTCHYCSKVLSSRQRLDSHILALHRKQDVDGSDSSVTSGVPARHPKRRRMIDGDYDDIGQRGGGYGDRDHDLDDVDDGVREGGSDEADESEAEDTGDNDDASDADDESSDDDVEDDPMDYKDPVGSMSQSTKHPFEFIMTYMKQDVEDDGIELSPNDVNKLFRDYYRDFVLFCRSLRRNKIHKMIMSTVRNLMNTNEDEKWSFREALEEGIKKRKYLLDGKYQSWIKATDTDDILSDEEEAMD